MTKRESWQVSRKQEGTWRGLQSHREKGGKSFENQEIFGIGKCVREAKKTKNRNEAIGFCFQELNDNFLL